MSRDNEAAVVPQKDEQFVPFGFYTDAEHILKSKTFYPFLVTGETGNGKTYMIEQACANLGLEMMRVNVTVETDEDSLMGGFRLANGDTVFHEGPVIEAMRRGCVLLLDEIDLLSPSRAMCLQSVLEGKGYYIKRTNTWVQPAPGFTVLATANTKGTGDERGVYVATNIMNEAFLERIAATFEHDYADAETERKILNNRLDFHGLTDKDSRAFADILVDFASKVRDAIKDGADLRHTISTRRLLHIINAYKIWTGDRVKALEVSLSRFDKHHKDGFMDFYRAVDPMTAEEEKKVKDEDFDLSKLQPW